MSGFHRQRLRQLRRAAGLLPMPAFTRDYGHILVGEEYLDYIDGRYFSPEARHWMREVSQYHAQGRGTLPVDDEECSDRVLTAMIKRRTPSPGQEARFKRKRLLNYAEGLMPILLQREMKRRGHYYGPDAELSDDVELPSAQELLFKHMAAKFGTTKGAAKAAFYRWRKEATGTH